MNETRTIDSALDELADEYIELRETISRPFHLPELGKPLLYSPLSHYPPITAFNARYAVQLLGAYILTDARHLEAAWERLPDDLKERLALKIRQRELDAILVEHYAVAAELKWQVERLQDQEGA